LGKALATKKKNVEKHVRATSRGWKKTIRPEKRGQELEGEREALSIRIFGGDGEMLLVMETLNNKNY